MNKRLDELMPQIFELHSLGWSYTKIAKKFNLSVNSVRRRIITNNKLLFGEQRYYKNNYVIELYDFITNEKVGTFRNATQLKEFLGRKTGDFLAQALSRKQEYVYSKDKAKKYRFKIVEKDKANNG